MLSSRLSTGLVLIFLYAIINHTQTRNRILGILFVEKDTTLVPQMQPAVLQQLKFIQQEFLSNFQATFELGDRPVRIVSAGRPGNYYENTISSSIPGSTRLRRFWRLENIREEIVKKLKLDGGVRVLVYPTSKRDGNAAAYVNKLAGQGGYMDFDDFTCRYGAGESTPYSDGNESVSTHLLLLNFFDVQDWGSCSGIELLTIVCVALSFCTYY